MDDLERLHVACASENLELVQQILSQNTAISCLNRDDLGVTPVHLAARVNSPAILDALLTRCADAELGLTARDITGSTPLHYAARHGALDSCKYLVEKQRVNVNVENDEGNKPLHESALAGAVVTLRYLLDHGAAINAQNNKGSTALHYAAYAGQLDCIKMLMFYEADAMIQNKLNQTPAQTARAEGLEEIATAIEQRAAALLRQKQEEE